MSGEWEDVSYMDELKEDEYGGKSELIDSCFLLDRMISYMRKGGLFSSGGGSSSKITAETPGEMGESTKKMMSESSTTISKEELLQMINAVMNRLLLEGYRETSIEMSKARKIESLMKVMNLNEAAVLAQQLMREWRPFNIEEFLVLYKQTDESSDALKDQLCWVLAGPTGVGKSTTIHYLAGSKMAVKPGTEHITYTEITNPVLKDLPEDAIKPGESVATSETRYIAGVPIDIEGMRGVGRDEVSVMLVDSPGFEDSQGPEMDLSNGLGMVNALRKAKRVKLIVVMSKYNFTLRMLPVKKLTSTLSGVLKGYDKVLQKNTAVFLTKATEDYTTDLLRDKFAKAYKEEESMADKNEGFQEFAYQMKNGNLPAECVFPLQPEMRQMLLERVINDVAWIKSPKRVFQSFINGDTMTMLKQQFLKYKSMIRMMSEQGLNQERCDWISSKLMMMREMCIILPTEEKLAQLLSDCESIAKEAWNSSIHKAKEALANVSEVSKDGFMKLMDEFAHECGALEGCELNGLMNEVNSLDTVKIYMNECMDHLSEIASEDSIAKMNALLDRFGDENPKLKARFDHAMKEWNHEMDVACNECRDLMLKYEWNELLLKLIQINDLFNIIGDMNGNIKQLKKDLKKTLYNRVKDSCNEFDFVVRSMDELDSFGSGSDMSESIMNLSMDSSLHLSSLRIDTFDARLVEAKLGECEKLLEECVDSLQRSALISVDFGMTALNVQRFFHKELVRYCGDYLLKPAQELFDDSKNDGSNWTECETYLKRCAVIRKVSSRVDSATSDLFYALRSAFQARMEEVSRQARDMIDECNRADEDADGESVMKLDYSKLVTCINSLSKAGCSMSDEKMKVISSKLVEFVHSLKERAEVMKIKVERSELLTDVRQIMQQLTHLSRLQDTMPDLKEQSAELFATLKRQILDCLIQCSKKFDLESRALKHLQIEKKALEALSSNLKMYESTANDDQFKLVYQCRSSDLTRDLITPMKREMKHLNDRRAKLMVDKTKREGEIGTRVASLKDSQKRAGTMIENGMDHSSIVKKAGFNTLREITDKIEELTKQLQCLCPDLDSEIESIDERMKQMMDDERTVQAYISKESKCLDDFKDSPCDAVWWSEYRCNKARVKKRVSELHKRLITGDKYNFEDLDLALSMHSLMFVEQARMINFRKMDSTGEITGALELAEKNVSEYLVKYGEHWNHKFTKEFNACVELSEDDHKSSSSISDAALIEDSDPTYDDLDQETRVELLNSRLRELQKICSFQLREADGNEGKLCRGLFKKDPINQIGEVYDKLTDKHKYFVARLPSAAPVMRQKIADLCFALSIVDDSFIRYAVRVYSLTEKRFSKICDSIQTDVSKEISELKSRIIPSFNERDYNTLEITLTDMQDRAMAGNRRSYNQACAQVAQKLSELYTDAIGRALQVNDKMSTADMFELNNQLQIVQHMAKICRPHIPESMKPTIDSKSEQLKLQLADGLKVVLDSVKSAAANASFCLAEKRLATANQFSQYLNAGMLEESMIEDIRKQLGEARTAIDESLEKVVDSFEKVDLINNRSNPFTRCQPKHVFEEMTKVSEDHPFYKTKWLDIEQSLCTKFAEACAKINASEAEEPLPFAQAKALVRRLDTCLRWLPEHLSQQIQFEVDDAKEAFQEVTTQQQSSMKEALSTGSWKEVALSMASLDTADPALKRQTMTNIKKAATDFTTELSEVLTDESKVDGSSLADCKQVLSKMNSYAESLLTEDCDFTDKAGMSGQLQKSISQMVNSFCNVASNIVSSLSKLSSLKDTKPLEDQIAFLSGLMSHLLTKGRLCEELFPADQREIVERESDKLARKVSEMVGQLVTEKKKASEERDMVAFGKLLDDLLPLTEVFSLLSNVLEFRGVEMEAPTYSHTVDEVKTLLDDRKTMIIRKGLDNEESKKNDASRTGYFTEVKTGFEWFSQVSKWDQRRTHLGYDPRTELVMPCVDKIKGDASKLTGHVKSVMDEAELNYDNLTDLNTSMEILKCCDSAIPEECFSCQPSIDDCRKKLKERVLKASKAATIETASLDTTAKKLIELQKMKELVDDAEQMSADAVAGVIDHFHTNANKKLKKRVLALAPKLTDLDPQFAVSVMKSHSAFAAAANNLRVKRMVEMNIDDVITKLKGYNAKFDMDRLKEGYEKANITYDTTLRSLIAVESFEEIKFDTLIDNIQALQSKAELPAESMAEMAKRKFVGWFTGKSKSDARTDYWTEEMIENIPEMIGLVFALWTLKNSKPYFDADSDDADSSGGILLQPRVAQFVSILCLLGLDEEEDARAEGSLVNNLVEIGTGEGKSLTLAVTSIVLALLGFDVSCGCYSALLSQRDYENYENLFDALNVAQYIHYGTFNALFERTLNNRINLRRSVEDMLSNKELFKSGDDCKSSSDGSSSGDKDAPRPSILLIDEVDVFFQKEFFGALYSLSTIYNSESFSKLIRWVWEQKKNSEGNLVWKEEDYTNSDAFKAVQSEFVEEWHPLLKEALKDVFEAANTFEDDKSYVVKDGRIGYKVQDTVSFKAFKGYKTMLTYLKEADEGRVSEETAQHNLGFFVKIASFSYAEVPQTFCTILGVTGTLKTLTDKEKAIMERDYGIKKHVYNPSLFGANQLKFRKNSDTHCVDASTYQFELVEAIKRARNASDKVSRPVLVIFEDKLRLESFESCEQFQNLLNNIGGDRLCLKLTEELTDKEKRRIIGQASNKGLITLATASFGRGIDFQVYDDVIDSNGGMHVECGFFSESHSEEVQFRGRTARQGCQGSFHMTVDIQNCLEKFGISEEEINDVMEERIKVGLYEFINEKRNDRFVEAYDEMAKVVQDLKPIHAEAEEFVAAMTGHDWKKAAQMLIERNEGAFLGQVARMCIVIDATASMGQLLNQVKSVIQKVIPQLQSFLVENAMDKNMFQIQVTYYRNYNAPAEELVIASDYTSEATELVQFMQPVGPAYGWGPEATEVGLSYVSGLSDLPQFVLLIGDAPSNEDRSVVTRKRKERGESYWSAHPQFASATDWEEQVQKLKENEVQINTFYLMKRAQSNFDEIARRSNGVSRMLDVSNTDQSVKALTGAVADQVLSAIGGGSRHLMDAYHKKHKDIPSFL